MSLGPLHPCGWQIEGPKQRQANEVHVYAWLDGSMIAMLDCELRDSGGLKLRMAYVSPPWRGSAVLRDMLAVLKPRYRQIALRRVARHGGEGGRFAEFCGTLPRHDAVRKPAHCAGCGLTMMVRDDPVF